MTQAVGEPELTLAQRLARFDPRVHAGEMMVDAPRGAESGAVEQTDVAVDGSLSTGSAATGKASLAAGHTRTIRESHPAGVAPSGDTPRGGADPARGRNRTR